MRVLHVHWRYDGFGGGEIYLRDLCDALDARGHTAAVLSSRELNGSVGPDRRLDLIDGSFGIASGMRMRKRVREAVAARKPDVIHLHETMGFMSPLIVHDFKRRFPVVQTLHTAFYFCPAGTKILPNGELCGYPLGTACMLHGCRCGGNRHLALNMLWRSMATRTLDRVIAPSAYLAEVARTNGIAENKISVIPLFTTKNPGGSITEPDRGRILFVARPDPLKGGDALLSALHMIRKETWSACFIGGGPDAERRAEELGIRDRIDFHAPLPYGDLDGHYRRAAIVAFPSISPESFGIVGIEAMSFGRPVVAFDSGGGREWLHHGQTGFMADRGDVEALARYLRTLLADESLRSRMGQQSMRVVADRFRKDRHIREVISVYETAVRSRAEKQRHRAARRVSGRRQGP